MSLSYRRSFRVAGTRATVSPRGVSLSKRLGPVTVNSRGRVSVRLAPGLMFRLGSKR